MVFEDAKVGIEAGHRAGFPVVAVTTTHPAEDLQEADLVVDSLAELSLEMIGQLLSGKPRHRGAGMA